MNEKRLNNIIRSTGSDIAWACSYNKNEVENTLNELNDLLVNCGDDEYDRYHDILKAIANCKDAISWCEQEAEYAEEQLGE